MRRLLFAAITLAPLTSFAAAEGQPREWTDCVVEDSECVVVKGVCSPAAVNVKYDAAATAFFAKRAKEADCVQKFWMPTAEGSEARCRLERCELVGKEAK